MVGLCLIVLIAEMFLCVTVWEVVLLADAWGITWKRENCLGRDLEGSD